MPRYCFECECGNEEEFFNSISDGPPKKVICEKCKGLMYHSMGCNFVLIGDNWPGKQASKKQENYELQKVREQTDTQLAEDSKNQRIVEDVTNVRRNGRKATDSLRRNDPQKWNDYNDAMKKGYRPKEKKSYLLKKMGGTNLSE